MIKSGLAFHIHHDVLIEFCYDCDVRVEFIKKHKPPEEQELRLRLFQLIPLDRLPKKGLKAYGKAGEAYDKVREAYDKAREAYIKAWEAYLKAREAYIKAGEAYIKAREAYLKAREAYIKAWEAYIKANKQAIEKLHTELCPDCPWDGETIFSKEMK